MIVSGCDTSGPTPATRKKTWAEAHIAIAGPVALNSTRRTAVCRRARRDVMIRPSRATSTVPAAGPNSNAAMMVNASLVEKLAGNCGKRRTNEPLRITRPASTYQSIGGLDCANSTIDTPMMRAPATMTAGK